MNSRYTHITEALPIQLPFARSFTKYFYRVRIIALILINSLLCLLKSDLGFFQVLPLLQGRLFRVEVDVDTIRLIFVMGLNGITETTI